MRFAFDISLTEKDYYDFNMFHMQASDYGKKQYFRIRILLVAILMAGGFLNLLYNGIDAVSVLILAFYAMLSVIVYFCYKPYMQLFVKLHFKNLKKQGRLPFPPQSTIVFQDESFTESTPTNKSEYSYSIVESVYLVNESIFYIFINTTQAFLLPVSAFESEEQYKTFLSFIAEKTVAIKMRDFNRSPFMQPQFPKQPE